MFEKRIEEYELLLTEYLQYVSARMSVDELRKYNEILFSAHSCAIEGNSFSVNDTRELMEKGLGLIPQGKSLFESFEILDHFQAYEYLFSDLSQPMSEELLKQTHKLLTQHTITYHHKDAIPGEYTDTDMAAGDTIFGEHEKLISRIPDLLATTQAQLDKDDIHPMILAARFHGFFEYLHPFRDGNGRLGRLLSNYILQKKGHPIVIIPQEMKATYIEALKAIRKENTDTILIDFFFQTAIDRMKSEITTKKHQSRFLSFIF